MAKIRSSDPLVAFVETVFRDIAEPDQEDLLRSCYVYSRNLETIDSDLQVVVQDAVPRFVVRDAAEPVEFRESDAGDFGRGVVSAAGESVGSVFMLLGGIGAGKTTFLKRFFHFVGREAPREATLWFYLDLRAAPVDRADIESFVSGAILRELRGRYGPLQLETREHIRKAYTDEIAVLEQSTFTSNCLRRCRVRKAIVHENRTVDGRCSGLRFPSAESCPQAGPWRCPLHRQRRLRCVKSLITLQVFSEPSPRIIIANSTLHLPLSLRS